MDLLHAILFALLQGVTELFPVSSLGHAVIVPPLLHWPVNQASDGFLPFLVMLHLGTAAGLLAYFWSDWLGMLNGVLGRGGDDVVAAERRQLGLLILATLPAVVVGIIVHKPVQQLFASPLIACLFLIANAVLLALGEWLRRRGTRRATGMTNADAIVIGLFQCLAFLPGISRSGAAMVGALRRGLPHEQGAKFAFLMGTPVILAASVAELPKLLHRHALHSLAGLALVAAVVAGLAAYASTAFLMRYFRDHDGWALLPFAVYSAVFGACSFALLKVGL